jgi:AcrR family transcriptional regulator
MARTRLNRERVLKAALRIADESGIESLSMRRLARSLGVEAMSLYNHVASKDDLVQGIVDLVLEEIELPEEPDWSAAIRRCAISAHEAFLRHPWACSLVIAPSPSGALNEPRLRYMEWLLGRLRAAGFPAELVYSAYHALDSQILGFTLWQLGHVSAARALGDVEEFAARFAEELRERDYPHLAEHVEQHLAAKPGDGAREFEFALDLLLAGLARLLTQPAGRRPARPARRAS